VRELRFGGNPFGPYVNRNHFAGLMELLAPTGLALLLLRGLAREKLPLVGLSTLVPIAALFLSGSRGGILSFAFQFLLLGLLLGADPARPPRRWLPAAAVLLLLAGGLVVWVGPERLLERLGQFSADTLSRDQRPELARDTGRIFFDHPVLGTGLGTLITVYPQYASRYDGTVVDHAHNDFLELLAETGLIGGLCALGFLYLFFRTGLERRARERSPLILSARTGALVACAGLLLHSLADFHFHIPSHAILFLLLAHVATVGSDAGG